MSQMSRNLPLKWGHLSIQETLLCPRGVHNREVPLYFEAVHACSLPNHHGNSISVPLLDCTYNNLKASPTGYTSGILHSWNVTHKRICKQQDYLPHFPLSQLGKIIVGRSLLMIIHPPWVSAAAERHYILSRPTLPGFRISWYLPWVMENQTLPVNSESVVLPWYAHMSLSNWLGAHMLE